jgi:hypothetical protein
MKKSMKMTLIPVATVMLMSQPLVGHAVVTVDPGAKVSAGKTIVGSSQNLPTMNSIETWDIGSEAKDQVNAYYTSSALAKDRKDVANSASAWTRGWLKKTCGSLKPSVVKKCKAAAVFDIDETLFTAYNVASTNTPAFSYDSKRLYVAETTCLLPTIRAAKKLLTDFQNWGINIYLITGRKEPGRAVTIACLNAAGISGWKSLIMKQMDDTNLPSVYKANARKAIEATGVKIGPSIGDQISDMAYGYLGRGFLLPNLMYLVP